MEGNIKYLAVGRSSDQAIIATYSSDGRVKDSPRSELRTILSHNPDSAWQSKLDSNFGTWVLSSANGITYMVLTKNGYPDRFSGNLLKELTQMFEQQGLDVVSKCGSEAFTNVLKNDLKNLAGKYEDLKSLDRIYGINADIMEVQNIASASIQQVMKNTAAAEDLAAKASNMEGHARMFHGDAKKLERMMYLRKLKINCILACVVISILLYIIVPIIISNSD